MSGFMSLSLCSVMAVAFVVSGVLCGCKSPPAEKEVFIPPEYAKLMKDEKAGIGLHKVWGRPDLIRKYKKIDIGVVISPRQLEESTWSGINVRYLVSSRQNEMKYVAQYARESFVRAFKNSNGFKLADKPGPDTLALEFAIVQVIPNKPVLGALSNISSLTPIGLILLPIKMGAKGVSSNTGGAIAMESVIRDSETGKVIAVFADREKGKVALFNAKEFTAYANIRAIIDLWTKNIVAGLNQVREGKKLNVQTSDAFTPIDF